MIALLVMTDGRDDYLKRTIESVCRNLHGRVTLLVIHDDTGQRGHAAELAEHYGPMGFRVITSPTGRSGFGGAIRSAWSQLPGLMSASTRFVFHLEDDFTFAEGIHLDHMAAVLDAHPHLVQLALKRQPWNAEEIAAGGIVEAHPDDFDERIGEGVWTEHRKYFTTNPCLYRRALLDIGWPAGDRSEGVFTHRLLADADARFAFLGRKYSAPKAIHIGDTRAGEGY